MSNSCVFDWKNFGNATYIFFMNGKFFYIGQRQCDVTDNASIVEDSH